MASILPWTAVHLALWAAYAALPAPAQEPVAIEFFTRPGCVYCARARDFLDDLKKERPEVVIVRRELTRRNRAALARLQSLARQAGVANPAVPAFYVRGRLIVGFGGGFGGSARSEELIRRALDADPESLWDGVAGACTDAPAAACAPLADAIDVPGLGTLSYSQVGLPVFTVVIGLVDGFNPCAMWVLLFLLSLLINLKSRARMTLIAGTFVAVSGAVYFAFMSSWLSLFLLIGMSRPLQWLIGLSVLAAGALHIKDFFAPGRGPSLSIPRSMRPGIYARVHRILRAPRTGEALISVAALAVMVNMVELLCTAGLPAVYTQILSAQNLPAWRHYGYLVLYNAAYILDDALILAAAVATFSRWKLQEPGGLRLKLVSGAVMAILGLILIFRPDWLAWI